MKLKNVKPYVWVHLMEYPDRLDKAGPTEFEVSHANGEVSTRDKTGSPVYRVSGKERTEMWLNTSVLGD